MLHRLKYYCLHIALICFVFSIDAQQPVVNATNTLIVSPERITQEIDSDLVKDSTEPSLIDTIFENCKEASIDTAQLAVCALVIYAIATITHEHGHATAFNLLFDLSRPSQVHIGTTTPATTPHLFSLGNTHFYKTIPWMSGLTVTHYFNKPGFEKYHNLFRGITTAAGGLSSATLLYTFLVSICSYCAYADGKKISEITQRNFANSFSPFQCIVQTKNLSFRQKRLLVNATLIICTSLFFNITYGCFPYCEGDGINLWRNYIGVQGTPLLIFKWLTKVVTWGSYAILFKKYYDAREQLLYPNPT